MFCGREWSTRCQPNCTIFIAISSTQPKQWSGILVANHRLNFNNNILGVASSTWLDYSWDGDKGKSVIKTSTCGKQLNQIILPCTKICALIYCAHTSQFSLSSKLSTQIGPSSLTRATHKQLKEWHCEWFRQLGSISLVSFFLSPLYFYSRWDNLPTTILRVFDRVAWFISNYYFYTKKTKRNQNCS